MVINIKTTRVKHKWSVFKSEFHSLFTLHVTLCLKTIVENEVE